MNLLIFIAWLITATYAISSENVTTTESPNNSTKEILKASETGDSSKIEIVKQIRRLNDDGSYTIGYEANDGTFKIESRDVLGNVKGTFGYVDDDGEIKRVTYSAAGDSTPIPVTTSTTPSTPMMIVRVNKTISSTTRRPLPTVVYPTRASATTKGTVIQPIPRRRPTSSIRDSNSEVVKENQKPEESTSNIINLYKQNENTARLRNQVPNPGNSGIREDSITKRTTSASSQTIKPVYEHVTEREPDIIKSNTIRRQLPLPATNHHMMSLQQSMGDDSTDIYGSHLSHGTVRPLFTTTTSRSRLVPVHSLVAARHRLQEQYQDSLDNQETNIEASTGRVFDEDSAITSTPVPVVRISPAHTSHRPTEDPRIYQQHLYRRPQSTIQFRTQEYLKDNPGAPIPIGNQRPFLHYEYQNKVLDPQLLKDTQAKAQNVDAATVPYEVRPVTRIVPIPVDERGVPIQGYEARFVNPYQPQQVFSRYEPNNDNMNSISAPVSTRDLKRLLQILILRQSRLQNLMDQLMPEQSFQPYRQDVFRQQRRYDDDDRYDYRYDHQYRQEAYSNQDSRYEDSQYDQRYIPRRRHFSRPYDTAGSASNHIEEVPEYLPVEIREALLLKMLLLAISPDYLPRPLPATELTTAAPTRKQVRNVQILGEDDPDSKMKSKFS